jgi:RNA recognition motif-containing protein
MSENHFDLIYGEIFGTSNFDKPSVNLGKKPTELIKIKEPKKEVSNQKPKD